MRILLVNVDARWNLAVRRMYAYFLQEGHQVEMRDLGLSGYPHDKWVLLDASDFDQVYVSNIFARNADRVEISGCNSVQYGGIGSRDQEARLPPEIEATPPYYAPGERITYGYLTRGCIRSCWFCKVPAHEGYIRKYADGGSIVRGVPGEIVKLQDNNILAHPDHLQMLRWLADSQVRCRFDQGLDFRLVTDENLAELSRMNYYGEYIFAFDDIRYQAALEKKMPLIKKHLPKPWSLKFYIYYHPDMGLDSLLARVDWCRAHECLPYVMRDESCWDCADRSFLIDFAAYCNQASMFKTKTFPQFLDIREMSPARRAATLKTYKMHRGEVIT